MHNNKIKDKIKELEKTINTATKIAKELEEITKDFPSWIIEFQYPINNVLYNIDLESLSKSKLIATRMGNKQT